MWDDVLLIIGAYILSAIPVVYLLGRLRGFDLSKEEDMHISLWRKVGRREGFIGIMWDVVKGGVAVVIMDRFSILVCLITSCRDFSSRSNSVNPSFLSSLNRSWRHGFLKFVSTSKTLSPLEARAVAKLLRTVEFPSSFAEEKKRIVFIFSSASELTRCCFSP